METTKARADAEHAAQAWLGHKRHCPRCAYRARIRDWAWLCLDGMRLRDENVRASADLAESKRLDLLPAEGQEVMFAVAMWRDRS